MWVSRFRETRAFSVFTVARLLESTPSTTYTTASDDRKITRHVVPSGTRRRLTVPDYRRDRSAEGPGRGSRGNRLDDPGNVVFRLVPDGTRTGRLCARPVFAAERRFVFARTATTRPERSATENETPSVRTSRPEIKSHARVREKHFRKRIAGFVCRKCCSHTERVTFEKPKNEKNVYSLDHRRRRIGHFDETNALCAALSRCRGGPVLGWSLPRNSYRRPAWRTNRSYETTTKNKPRDRYSSRDDGRRVTAYGF